MEELTLGSLMASGAQEGKEERERGSHQWMRRAVGGEPSGTGDGILMLTEVSEDISQDGILPKAPWKNRVMS